MDLARRDLALVFEGSLRGKALPAKLAVKGPWARPRIYPDIGGILEKPEDAFAALKKLDWPETGTP